MSENENLDFEFMSSSIPSVESMDKFVGLEPKTNTKPTEPEGNEGDEAEENTQLSFADFNDTDDDIEPITSTTSNTNDDEPSSNRALADYFVKAGFIDEFEEDEFEDDEDWLHTKVSNKLESKSEEVLDPVIKEINDLYKQGYNLEDLIKAKSEQIKFEKITDDQIIDDEKLQKAILKEYLEYQDNTEEEIDEILEGYADANLLEKQALKAKSKLLAAKQRWVEDQKVEAENQRRNNEAKEQQNLMMLKNTLEGAPEFIKGIPTTKEDKVKMFEFATKKDREGYTQYQRMLVDPTVQLKMLQFLAVLNGDFTKVEKKLQTKVAKQIQKTANNDNKQSSAEERASLAMKALQSIKKQNRFI